MPVIVKPDIDSPEQLELHKLRHSCAHLMAEAVQKLWPDAKLAIGPAIENGFYYDFDLEHRFTDDDLTRIEDTMTTLVKQGKDIKFERTTLSKSDAIKKVTDAGQERYKLPLIERIPEGEEITFYTSGEFFDLCAGPHVENKSDIKHFKLLKISGAYWEGKETNKMLQRIYGTCFASRDELKEYLRAIEEAEKRDHRKLGPMLDLFTFFEEAGPGLVFYLPKGAMALKQLQDWGWQEHMKRGYQPLQTPHILKTDAWHTSGHWDNYRENMYQVGSILEYEELMQSDKSADESKLDIYGLKPMNCPGHVMCYKANMRSYRDLPLRFCENGTVYRYERAGVLHGMLRVRGFTQDDAHHFCTPEQYEAEIELVMDFCSYTLDAFGFDYMIGFKTKPVKAVGNEALWEMAEAGLKRVLDRRGQPYYIQEGDGTFYGPKVDFVIKDSLGRSWQGSTVQLDFNLPNRFNLTYIGEDGKEHQPVMIHRAIYGSFERFFGLLIEEFGGAFPLWLAPVQAMVLPVSDKYYDYAKKVAGQLQAAGIRAQADVSGEKLGKMIRTHTTHKVIYLLVVGEKELTDESVAGRHYYLGELGAMPINHMIERMQEEIKEKKFFKK